ncbi:TolC family protein [Tannerella sp.]|uniref:TolC family protein n=1 Tax=Tannerella sp. TaxID=2382127 RepID=UPI0026DB4A56|nr:TolC family protein [Tannerella sp.]
MMKRTIRIRLSLLLFAGVLSAQEPVSVKKWSLQECIDYAKEHNLEVRMQQINVQQQEVTLSTARSKRLPDLSASASQGWNFGRSPSGYDNTYKNQNARSTNWSLSTNVPVFTGFRITNEVAAAKLNLQAVAAELEKVKENMEISITSAYLQVLYQKELLGVSNEQLALSREQLERIRSMHAAGRASEAQIYEVEAQVANDELSVVQAESDLQIALLGLTQLLELPSPEGFAVEEPAGEVELLLARRPEDIYRTALTTRASVRADALRLQGSEKNIGIARSAYYPTLSFGAGYGNNYYFADGFDNLSFSEQLKKNRNQYFGFNVSVPIFSRWTTRNGVRSAKLDKRMQELRLENTKKALYKDIQQAYYNALAAGEKYKASEAAYVSARKSFGYMDEKFANGRATVYEYNQSKTSMTKAMSNRTQAKYEYLLRKKIMEFYEGAN